MRAMNGEMSIMPIEGTTRRMGAMIGSVRSIRTRWIVVFPVGSNQDMIARAMMPKLRIVRMSWIKLLTSLDMDGVPLLARRLGRIAGRMRWDVWERDS